MAAAVLGAVCAVALDVDVLPRLIGGADFAVSDGHRGITHSFALALGGMVALAASPRLGVPRGRLSAYLALATLSHGVLDAFSNYGSGVGVALLAGLARDSTNRKGPAVFAASPFCFRLPSYFDVRRSTFEVS